MERKGAKVRKKHLILIISVSILIIGLVILYFFRDILFVKNTEEFKQEDNSVEIYEDDKIEISEEIIDETNNKEEIDSLSDIFGKYYEKAENLMKSMSIEEKVGQMFLVRYPENGVIEEIKNYAPGGYILFGRDFENETKESILSELTNCQNTSKIKMIFGVNIFNMI